MKKIRKVKFISKNLTKGVEYSGIMTPDRIAGVIFGELPPNNRPNRYVSDIILAGERCGVDVLNSGHPLPDFHYGTLMVSRAMLDFSRFAIVDTTIHTPLTWFVAGMAAEKQIPTLLLLNSSSLPSTDYLDALRHLPVQTETYKDFENVVHKVISFLADVRKSKTDGKQVRELPTTSTNGDLAIDYEISEVSFRGERVDFTFIEYKLLARLFQGLNRVVPDAFLLDAGWGDGHGGDKSLLKTHISHIVKKLKAAGVGHRYIINRREVGYMMPKIEQITLQSGNGLAGETRDSCLDYYEEFLKSLGAGEGGVVKLDSGENPLIVRGHLKLAAGILNRRIEFFRGDREGDHFFVLK